MILLYMSDNTGGLSEASIAKFEITERYFDLLKESKIRGYLFQQQNYVPEK